MSINIEVQNINLTISPRVYTTQYSKKRLTYVISTEMDDQTYGTNCDFHFLEAAKSSKKAAISPELKEAIEQVFAFPITISGNGEEIVLSITAPAPFADIKIVLTLPDDDDLPIEDQDNGDICLCRYECCKHSN